jgi:peptidoglycan L-alanyl-D-glutamate endopeptidase CwlK
MALDDRSLKNLQGVHPDLVRVFSLAAERSKVPIIVTEGLRTVERQRQLKAAGKSWTLNSRHLNGHAIDVVDGDDFKYDIPDMDYIAGVMKAAAADLGVDIEWGGDWKSRDTPHFELSWKTYPETGLGFVSRMKERAVDIAKSKPSVVTVSTGVGVGIVETVDKIPPPPDLTSFTAWRVFSTTAIELGAWVWANPGTVALIGAWIGGTLFWPQVKVGAERLIGVIAAKRRTA